MMQKKKIACHFSLQKTENINLMLCFSKSVKEISTKFGRYYEQSVVSCSLNLLCCLTFPAMMSAKKCHSYSNSHRIKIATNILAFSSLKLLEFYNVRYQHIPPNAHSEKKHSVKYPRGVSELITCYLGSQKFLNFLTSAPTMVGQRLVAWLLVGLNKLNISRQLFKRLFHHSNTL
ncbi:hypothetical protein HOLleu_07014 [Holothuria leucospilota]|uniref:Uncharacterized protein n=1 Tax=Holothuria leucospilota TaxID=206669 RepID=A0A9Q1CNR3_HOLLE|nr:hypothetical protein HOLleu_07014 [Holothuria leucospilota]